MQHESTQVEFRVILGFGSFGFGLSQISSHLISGHLMFRVVRIGSDFRLSDLGSSQVFRSFRFQSGRVSGYLISDHLGFLIVRVRIESDSNQFNFLKKSDHIRFESRRIEWVFQIKLNFATSRHFELQNSPYICFLLGNQETKFYFGIMKRHTYG
jgi:hypothetical protein